MTALTRVLNSQMNGLGDATPEELAAQAAAEAKKAQQKKMLTYAGIAAAVYLLFLRK